MARYSPGSPPLSSENLAAYVQSELNKIAQALDTEDQLIQLATLYAPPNKYRDGTIVVADGSTWNPGSGAGVYCRRGAAWIFLG